MKDILPRLKALQLFKHMPLCMVWEEVKNTTGVVRIRQSKDRQNNVQKKVKKTNNELQSTSQKTTDWVARTPGAPEGKAFPAPQATPVVFWSLLKTLMWLWHIRVNITTCLVHIQSKALNAFLTYNQVTICLVHTQS